MSIHLMFALIANKTPLIELLEAISATEKDLESKNELTEEKKKQFNKLKQSTIKFKNQEWKKRN